MPESVLKIHASNTDKIGDDLLYEHIVYLAKEKGLAGVTVYRGIMGYGMSSGAVTSTRFWELTEKLPVLIEIIDRREKLLEFFKIVEPELLKMPKGCLVTIEPAEVLLRKPGKKDK